MTDAIEKLIDKAKKATNSLEALQYSQAALNAAHAWHVLKEGNKP